MAVTLREVAKAAGVSPATVSLVLNGHEEGRVSAVLAERVRGAAERLNYQPNLLARSLRTQESKTFALISREVATTPFAGAMLSGAQAVAWQHDSLLLFVNSDGDASHEAPEIRSLIQRQVDGFLYAAMFHQAVEVPEALVRERLVLLDCFDTRGRFDSVVPDEYQGARDGVAALVAAGHRRIAHVSTTDSTIAADLRLQAFRDVVRDAGIPESDALVVRALGSDAPAGYDAMAALLRSETRPTAVFCYTDRIAMGAYDAARAVGLSVPRDISIMGFDDQPYLADAMRPGLSTVKLPHYEMGVWAATRLIPGPDTHDSESTDPVAMKLHCPVVMRDSVTSPGA